MSISVNQAKMVDDVSLRSLLDNITEPAVIAAMDGEILNYNRQFYSKAPKVITKDNIQQILLLTSTVYETENILEVDNSYKENWFTPC